MIYDISSKIPALAAFLSNDNTLSQPDCLAELEIRMSERSALFSRAYTKKCLSAVCPFFCEKPNDNIGI
ncbi:uncharacterized protein Dvar_38060 [Desulfosarcina variabilis str. Montpellier]